MGLGIIFVISEVLTWRERGVLYLPHAISPQTPTPNRVDSEDSVNWILGRFCEGWVAAGAVQGNPPTPQHGISSFSIFPQISTNFCLQSWQWIRIYFNSLTLWALFAEDKILKVSCISKFLWSKAVSRVLMIHIVGNNGVTMVFCEQVRLGGTIVGKRTKQQLHNHFKSWLYEVLVIYICSFIGLGEHRNGCKLQIYVSGSEYSLKFLRTGFRSGYIWFEISNWILNHLYLCIYTLPPPSHPTFHLFSDWFTNIQSSLGWRTKLSFFWAPCFQTHTQSIIILMTLECWVLLNCSNCWDIW